MTNTTSCPKVHLFGLPAKRRRKRIEKEAPICRSDSDTAYFDLFEYGQAYPHNAVDVAAGLRDGLLNANVNDDLIGGVYVVAAISPSGLRWACATTDPARLFCTSTPAERKRAA